MLRQFFIFPKGFFAMQHFMFPRQMRLFLDCLSTVARCDRLLHRYSGIVSKQHIMRVRAIRDNCAAVALAVAP